MRISDWSSDVCSSDLAMLADSQAELYAGWSMAQDCARRYDNKPAGQSDPDVSIRASCAKLFCTELAGRVADRGVQVHAGVGYITEYKVERFYRDVRVLRLTDGPNPTKQHIHRRSEECRQDKARARKR